MKTITGILMTVRHSSSRPRPAAAQGNLAYQIERIVDHALTIAADALDDPSTTAPSGGSAGPGRATIAVRNSPRSSTRLFASAAMAVSSSTTCLGRRRNHRRRRGRREDHGDQGDPCDRRSSAVAPPSARSRSTLPSAPASCRSRAGPTRGRSSSVESGLRHQRSDGNEPVLQAPTPATSPSRTWPAMSASTRLSGDVVVKDGKPRMIEIESSAATCSLEQVESERVQVKSVSGDIIFKGKLAKTGRYDLSTHSGDVQVITGRRRRASNSKPARSAATSPPISRCKLGGTRQPPSRPRERGARRNSDIRGIANDGGAVLSLHSFSGDILISKR